MKKFLSSVLVTVMTVACMTIGMATGVSAADGDFSFDASAFYTTSTGSKIDPDVITVGVAGLYEAEITSGTKTFTPGAVGDFAVSKGKTLVDNTGKSFDKEMLAGGGRTISVTPAYPGTAYVYVYHDGSKTLSLNGSAAQPSDGSAVGKYTVQPYSVSCQANETFTVDLSTNIAFVGLEYIAGEVTTYNWTLDNSGLVNVDGSSLALGSATTTSLNNTLSYAGTGYELKAEYENISDQTSGVTVNGIDVTVAPTDDWFDVVAPRNYVSVEPAVDGNKTVYQFMQSDDSEKYLISVNDTNKSDTTAYVDFAGTGGDDTSCYVTLSTMGAKLCDDSPTAAVKLVVPYSKSEGKVTVKGTVIPTNNIGGKWKLVDFGCISVTTDNSKNVTLTSDNGVDVPDNAGPAVRGQIIDYSITLDLDAKTASGTILNGNINKAFENVPFAAGMDKIYSISFVTNNGNSISGGNDRGLLIDKVTIIEEASEGKITKTSSYETPAVYELGNDFYVVSVINSADVTSGENVVQNLSSGNPLDTSDTVYKNIQINSNIYKATDFMDGATDKDYLFASIINNDNATDSNTVITKIQTIKSVVQ